MSFGYKYKLAREGIKIIYKDKFNKLREFTQKIVIKCTIKYNQKLELYNTLHLNKVTGVICQLSCT